MNKSTPILIFLFATIAIVIAQSNQICSTTYSNPKCNDGSKIIGCVVGTTDGLCDSFNCAGAPLYSVCKQETGLSVKCTFSTNSDCSGGTTWNITIGQCITDNSAKIGYKFSYGC